LKDFASYVEPLASRENLPLTLGGASLGIADLYAVSPPQAVRARKRIAQDASEKGYVFR
jgi:hypothetical protein